MRHPVLLLIVLLMATGCGRAVDGAPRAAEADASYFFAGAVPTYGLTVGPGERARLAFLRALRRVDPCGLLTRDAMSKVGEIGSVGTLFAFDECEVDIKVPGESTRRFLGVQLEMTRPGDAGSCEPVLSLSLSGLPGAPPLPGPDQPGVRIGLISEQDCGFVQKVARQGVGSAPLPIRDAVGAYPAALAERDPCEVIPQLSVLQWNVGASQPYACVLSLRGGPVIRVALQPQLFDPETDTREHHHVGGVDLYVDTGVCAATAYVGPPMRRKILGGDYLPIGNVVIRPAVTVDSPTPGCEIVTGVAVAAAKLFG